MNPEYNMFIPQRKCRSTGSCQASSPSDKLLAKYYTICYTPAPQGSGFDTEEIKASNWEKVSRDMTAA
jgi:hypothetical protein